MGVKINLPAKRLDDGHHTGDEFCAGCCLKVFGSMAAMTKGCGSVFR